VLPWSYPVGYPGARAPKKDDGRRGPAATTGPRVFDTPRLPPQASHVAVAVDLVVAGAGAISSARGVTLELPCSLPGTYPGVQGSGDKMGDSEVHGPRATTRPAPAGSPRKGA
jgi:hypothetical protein